MEKLDERLLVHSGDRRRIPEIWKGLQITALVANVFADGGRTQ